MSPSRLSAICVIVGLIITTNAWSSEKNEAPVPGVVNYRHQVMEGVGKHMYASSLIVKGKVEGRRGDLAHHAEAMHGASLYFGDLFPEGTGPAKVETDALAAIWDKREDFVKANQAFTDATKTLAEAARGDDWDATVKAFSGVGKTCGGCHETFKKDDH